MTTRPRRYKNVSVGITSKSYELCLHGRFLAEQCGACSFEAPRLGMSTGGSE